MEQSTINIFIAVLAGAIGWFIRTLWDRQEKLSAEMATVHIMIARDYVSTAELASALGELRQTLNYIRDRLDEKPARRQGDHA